MGDWLGRTIELDVTNIAHGGVSVARHDGRVVFVADAIPGERVLARVSSDSKKSFWRAETVEVLEASHTASPTCGMPRLSTAIRSTVLAAPSSGTSNSPTSASSSGR